jgi:phosphatidate cytidylyltransferase
MLAQRILTVAVVLPLFLAALFLLPNLYWSLLLAAILALAAHEWARMAGFTSAWTLAYAAMVAGLAGAIAAGEHSGWIAQSFIYWLPGKFLYGLCLVFWLAIAPAWLYYRWEARNPLMLALVGVLVLLPFWHALAWLQTQPARLLLVLGVIWLADTAAYFSGRALGRHKLAPRISPGKTWEGALGAAFAVALYWAGVARIAPGASGDMASGLMLVLIMTAVSIEGDLFESWMKRVAGVKDSGTLLPGHGGVLDRVDALTSTLPLAALYFAYPSSLRW